MPRPRFTKLTEEKQRVILDIAEEEFARYGYQDASINRIIQAAGLSKGATYYYFEDKKDLYVTVMARAQQQMVEAIGELGSCDDESSYWARVRELIEGSGRLKLSDPAFLKLFTLVYQRGTGQEDEPDFKVIYENVSRYWERTISRGQELGAVRTDLTPPQLSRMVWNVFGTFDVRAIFSAEEVRRVDFRSAIDFALDTLRRLLTSRVSATLS